MRGRPGRRPLPRWDGPRSAWNSEAALQTSFAGGVSFHCSVSHFAAAEQGRRRGGRRLRYLLFPLTTGGLKFSGAEGAAGGRRACLYRGRCLGAGPGGRPLVINSGLSSLPKYGQEHGGCGLGCHLLSALGLGEDGTGTAL